MTPTKVRRALVPAAGFGTRFLPASKVIPKVMFPVIDKPIIQAVVETLIESGITDITFIVKPHVMAIKQHFEPFPALNELLERSGKFEEIEKLKKIESMADFHYVEQRPGRQGTGIAILSAKKELEGEPFFLCWSDEFFKADPATPRQLINAYEKYNGMIFGCVNTTDPRDGGRYGFVVGDKVEETVTKVKLIIEKPGVGKAPSNLASISGMVLIPEIFDALEKADREIPQTKELYHIDGIKMLMDQGLSAYGVEYQNYHYYDTGDKLGYLKALVELGIENKEFGENFKAYLKTLKI